MSQNPTIPPVQKRPPPKPQKIPPVIETAGPKRYPVDPFHGINKLHTISAPIRQPSASETDIEVVRHAEQLRGLERRVEEIEEIVSSSDKKLDSISNTLNQEINTRKLADAIKDDQKAKDDQKTKRLNAILVAIPLILSPILGFFASYMQKPAPDYKTYTVVVSQYTEDIAECKKISHSKESFVKCVREKQLQNTPDFDK